MSKIREGRARNVAYTCTLEKTSKTLKHASMRGGGSSESERGSLDEVDPFFMALLRSRQRRFVECIDICTEILAVNPYDQVSPSACVPMDVVPTIMC